MEHGRGRDAPGAGPGRRAVACLRFYRWSEPTLSLGYFQTYADRQEHPPSLPCAAVRRLTGGGAILHDAELTYSIVLPGSHPLAARRDELYQAVHGCLIEALGGSASRPGCARRPTRSTTGREPFLCFQRRSPGDVLIGRTKICGSAQRRRNGAVLQHGSLLWRASPAAPELPGVADIAAHPIELENAADLWLGGLGRRLGSPGRPTTWMKTRFAGPKPLWNPAMPGMIGRRIGAERHTQSRNPLTPPMALDRLE